MGNLRDVPRRILGRASVLRRFGWKSLCRRNLRRTHAEIPPRARRGPGQVDQAGTADGKRSQLRLHHIFSLESKEVPMRTRRVTALSLALTGLLFATWIVSGQQARRIDDAAVRNAGKTGEEWLTCGLTPGETRFSPLKQIDVSNVSRLGLAWSSDVGTGGGTQEATPLFWNGTLYGIT